MGRRPGLDDLLVPLEPDPPKKRARPNPRAGKMRSPKDTEKRRRRDQHALGFDKDRTTHDRRATFVTLAEDAGIAPEVALPRARAAPDLPPAPRRRDRARRGAESGATLVPHDLPPKRPIATERVLDGD